MLNLDTHILIYALTGELTANEKTKLVRETQGISAIVLWELAKLNQLRRIELDFDDPQLEAVLSGVHIWPITLPICRAMSRLDFKGDPADELIAATSLFHGVPLVTRDRRIKRSKVVPLTQRSRPPPVPIEETLEICAFIDAAGRSAKKGGDDVELDL